MPTGETLQTVTRKRPPGAFPIPKGQPLDKAENSRGGSYGRTHNARTERWNR